MSASASLLKACAAASSSRRCCSCSTSSSNFASRRRRIKPAKPIKPSKPAVPPPRVSQPPGTLSSTMPLTLSSIPGSVVSGSACAVVVGVSASLSAVAADVSELSPIAAVCASVVSSSAVGTDALLPLLSESILKRLGGLASALAAAVSLMSSASGD